MKICKHRKVAIYNFDKDDDNSKSVNNTNYLCKTKKSLLSYIYKSMVLH